MEIRPPGEEEISTMLFGGKILKGEEKKGENARQKRKKRERKKRERKKGEKEKEHGKIRSKRVKYVQNREELRQIGHDRRKGEGRNKYRFRTKYRPLVLILYNF